MAIYVPPDGATFVDCAVDTNGVGISLPLPGNWNIQTPSVGGPPTVVASGSNPASVGGTVSNNGWSVKKLASANINIGGGFFDELAVLAPTSATVEADYILSEAVTVSGPPSHTAYADKTFNVGTAPVVTRRRTAQWL